jgi:hypothetical protein
MIADTKAPTDEMLEKGFEANDAGAGVAWRENGYVYWEKGIQNIEAVQVLCKDLPLPFIVHFRIPTEGGRRPSLCHPFPIEKTTDLALKGRTKGYVLFHNGHWSEWRKWVLETSIGSKNPVPSGKWSDTRGMAFVASIYGLGVLDMINEKAAAFGPNEIEIVPGSGWSLEDGVWCSNMLWKRTYNGPTYTSRMCKASKCTRYDTDDSGLCREHQKTPVVLEGNVTVNAHCKYNYSNGTCLRIVNLDSDGFCPAHTKKVTGSVGGDPTEIPFEQAITLFQEKKISKKQFKKARRVYEKLLRDGKVKPWHQEASKEVTH